MIGKSRISLALAAAALASSGAVTTSAASVTGAIVDEAQTARANQQGDRATVKPTDTKTKRLKTRLMVQLRTRERRAGYGWTNAHAKRVARKARNTRRHRAAQKG